MVHQEAKLLFLCFWARHFSFLSFCFFDTLVSYRGILVYKFYICLIGIKLDFQPFGSVDVWGKDRGLTKRLEIEPTLA